MSSTDTNGGHQVMSLLGIVQLGVPSEPPTTCVTKAALHDKAHIRRQE